MDLEKVKQKLIEERNALAERVRKIEARIQRVDKPLDPDFAEQAVEQENDEVLDALDEVGRHELEGIEAALQRIEQGTYGICVTCGKPISVERLTVIPYADKCIACAM